MDKGINFRMECSECGRVFLSPDRKRKICPRCVGKVLERKEWEKKAKKKGDPEKRNKAPERQLLSPNAKPAPKSSPPLTEELRERILKEYTPYRQKGDVPWRNIHRLIAKEIKVPKILVAKALFEERIKIELSEERMKEIIRRYQEYVSSLSRPPRGRRKAIAVEMGIPYRAVVLTVRAWKREQPSVKELNRNQRFGIEKSYFQTLERKQPLADFAENMAEKIGCSPFQIFRYLDLLHDGMERLKKVPEATPEERLGVLTAYAEYLSADSPPEPFLHNLISSKTGVTPQTVHKTLLTYRLERLREAVLSKPS